jgi:hypothetical protein
VLCVLRALTFFLVCTAPSRWIPDSVCTDCGCIVCLTMSLIVNHVTTDGQPVSQSVLVSSPIWGSQPDVWYCLTVTVLSGGSPLWREVGSVICHSLSPLTVNRQLMVYIQLLFVRKTYIYIIYTWPLSVQAENSRSCTILCSSGYNGSLIT